MASIHQCTIQLADLFSGYDVMIPRVQGVCTCCSWHKLGTLNHAHVYDVILSLINTLMISNNPLFCFLGNRVCGYDIQFDSRVESSLFMYIIYMVTGLCHWEMRLSRIVTFDPHAHMHCNQLDKDQLF